MHSQEKKAEDHVTLDLCGISRNALSGCQDDAFFSGTLATCPGLFKFPLYRRTGLNQQRIQERSRVSPMNIKNPLRMGDPL